MLLVDSTLVGLFSCENQNDSQQSTEVSPLHNLSPISVVFGMRIEATPRGCDQAIEEMNEEFPNSPEILYNLQDHSRETSQFH